MTKKQFWFLSLTWGIILTIFGFIISIPLKLLKVKTYYNQYSITYEFGKNWGGLSLGPYNFVNINPTQHLLNHEFGHSLQNCYWGPNMIIITILSVIRYWYREIKQPITDYDDIWFEGTATYLGQSYKERGLA